MRIFIHLTDETGSKRTKRINLPNCPTTNAVTNEICKQLGLKKTHTILMLKYQPFNIRIVEDWPLTHYPIKNGSIVIIETIPQESGETLEKIKESVEQYGSDYSENRKVSFESNVSEEEESYLEQCLKRLLQAVREGNLTEVAQIMKDEPKGKDQHYLNRFMIKKDRYLLNEIGDSGRNSLHEAIAANHPEVVTFLLIKGANPRLHTVHEYTALQLAVKAHSPDILKILLEQSLVDVNEVTIWGTALHICVTIEDIKCLEVLLQYDADINAADKQGRKVVDVCSSKKVKEVLEKKGKMIKANNLTITKGQVFEVSSYMCRHKERIMVLNPFKQELVLEQKDKSSRCFYELKDIKKVIQVDEISWLMKDSYFYLKILFKSSEKKDLTIALRHEKTYNRWFGNLNQALHNIEHSALVKPVPLCDQVIEVLNDETNTISFHRRKPKEVPRPTNNESILNLPVATDAQEPNYFISVSKAQLSPKNQESPASSREDIAFNHSQVIAGSIINSKEYSSTKSPRSEYQYPEVTEETFIDSADSVSNSNSYLKASEVSTKFRKNSDKISILSEFKTEERPEVHFQDFQLIKLIGNGSFGHVYLARHKSTSKVYAMKVLNKKKLIAKKQLKYAVGEANILKKMDSPFIISLHYAFQTPLHLYMALDNCPDGDLSEVIIVRERLTQNTACFVIGQVILAIQYLHSKGILYRDLKPENILIAPDGYIKLTDFGLSKENCFSMSFCGSPAYLSPEMLQKKGVGFESDIYGIGTVLHQMVLGEPPYYDDDIDLMFDKIKKGKLRLPSFLSIQVQSLLGRLLEKEVSKRIGAKDFNQIKKHEFFKKLNWDMLAKKKLPAPAELFVCEEDREFEPVPLEKTESLKMEQVQPNPGNLSMMNRIKNFTFVRRPCAQRSRGTNEKLSTQP